MKMSTGNVTLNIKCRNNKIGIGGIPSKSAVVFLNLKIYVKRGKKKNDTSD